MRIVLLTGVAAMVAGCTNDVPVEARVAHGVLSFVAASWAPDDTCLRSLRIGRARQETLWEIVATDGSGSGATCPARLPVRYGVAPAGFRTVVPARPLTAGTSYALIGGGNRVLRGAFRYDGVTRIPVNHATGSAAWCEAQYPDSKPDWPSGCRVK